MVDPDTFIKNYYCSRTRLKLSELFTSNCTLTNSSIHALYCSFQLTPQIYLQEEVYNSNIIGRANLILTLSKIDAK